MPSWKKLRLRTVWLVAALAAWPTLAQEDQGDRNNWGVKPNTNWGVKPNTNWGIKPETAQEMPQPAPAKYPDATRQIEGARAIRFDPKNILRKNPKEVPKERPSEGSAASGKEEPGAALPGSGPGWTKLRGDQGWRDSDGNVWKKDRLHGDHWDISDSKGKKIREVDFEGNQIWPDGPKNKNKKP